MDQTAADAYGFQSYSPAFPGGLVVAPQTDQGGGEGIPAIALPKLPFGNQNPMFWLLVLLLVITGYVSGGFNVGVKKLGKIGARVG